MKFGTELKITNNLGCKFGHSEFQRGAILNFNKVLKHLIDCLFEWQHVPIQHGSREEWKFQGVNVLMKACSEANLAARSQIDPSHSYGLHI